MIETISQNERLDVLLVLALAFERKNGQPEEPAAGDGARNAAAIVGESFTALSADELEALKTRAALFDNLTAENRQIWQTFWLDKLRRRGRSLRLDEQVNPSQIVEVLRREPETIQLLILRNLPADLSRQIGVRLHIESDVQKNESRAASEEIVALIRRKFLSNFVGLEDIYEPNELDKFSIERLAEFVRQLGLRETAIACRGISSKESLAVFLNRFSEPEAKEIVKHITEMEKIEPFWVAEADRLVRDTWEAVNFQPDLLLQSLGLKLLALAYAARDWAAQKYTAQKLSYAESEQWLEYISADEAALTGASDREHSILAKRRKIIERLAVRFEWSSSI